jgi:hypothetical protein
MASNRSLRSPRSRPWLAVLPCAAALALWPGAAPARAWTPKTHQTIAWEAARLAPPDLARQLIKRRASYLAGVIEPFDDSDASRHRKDPDGGGSLDAALEDAVAQAVAAIRAHHSFDDIVFRMGVAAHWPTPTTHWRAPRPTRRPGATSSTSFATQRPPSRASHWSSMACARASSARRTSRSCSRTR